MAFGGSGGFSFGSNNNNNNSTGFGGFGTNNNTNNTTTNTGFGSSTTNTGFGASTSGTSAFGGGTGPFGTNTGGFGASTNTGSSLFGGNKPATTGFGTNTGTTSLFGGNNNATNTTGGFGSGGFGASTNTGGFGSNTTSNNTGGGFTFGGAANKPAFGSSTTTPLFGQGGAGTTGGFGSTGGAFGSSGSGTALNQPVGPSEGTASTAFSATSEKEPNGVTNQYQSITFQQPYQKYSFEELRLADYNAGRQFGNGSGQPGAFGSNAFGGFGSNNTAGFGANNNTTTNTANPFGAATTSASTFGSNTATTGFGGGTGLFGNTANKPATGLFGTQTSSAGTTGGLFGSTNNNTTNTNTTFGGSNLFGGQSTGSSLFGNNNNAQNQNKPAGGLFGNNSNPTGGGFSFGANNNAASNTNTNTSNNLFGAQPSGNSLFGNNNATNANTSNNLFGAQSSGSSLFGNKPANTFGTANTPAQTGGLFGTAANTSSNTGGGLFGNNNAANTNTSGGLFGNNNATNTGGGIFGNNNATNQSGQKPLFGSGFSTGNTGTGTTGGLFGNNNATNNQSSGGLFGNTNNNSGGFSFGNTAANKPTTSLFGNTTNNQQTGGLFGSTNSNANNVFGASQNNQNNQQQQEGVKHASLLDPNPYGQSSIWTGLPPPTPENAKPVFTPLTATQKMKESMMKPPPSLRLNQSRYMTPPRRNGFGFSYSTYGTPSSAASTPGGASLSGSMYGNRGFSGGSFGRSFNKSASVQNLRSQFTSDSDDIWKSGAFSSAHRNSSGSIKRLTIDRTIRNDLFSRPSLPALPASGSNGSFNGSAPVGNGFTNGEAQQDTTNKLKKRVSFENGTSGGLQNSQLNGESGALVRTETDDDEPAVEGQSGRSSNTLAESQMRGKDLAAVPEDRESDHVQSRPATDIQAQPDPKPGDYWMKPSRAEMAKIPRADLQKFRDFQVGRYSCGQVTFNGVVDLTALPLDDLYDRIVEIRLRSVTVYPDASSKPPVGKGLNVPSTISIENSWPRARNQPSSATSGPVFEKHVQRLKKMAGTEFVNYEVTAGVWTFRVPHYTRYGLDYDDDDDDDDMSELTAPPESIEKGNMDVDSDEYEHEDENDTFAFRQKVVPGGFGRQSVVDYEPRPTAQAVSTELNNASEHSDYSDEEMSEDEPSMAGSYPAPAALNLDGPNKPILKPGLMGTPSKALLDLEGDWAEQLQRTISPRKQNREALRETQNKVLLDRVYSPIKPRAVEKKDFRTSIDVMNSIFGQHEAQRTSGRKQAKATEPEFEFPYAKRAKTFDSSLENMSDADKKWHESFKTQFTGTGDFIFKIKSASTTSRQSHVDRELISAQDEVVLKSSLSSKTQLFDLKSAMASSEVSLNSGAPQVQHRALPFSHLAQHLVNSSAPTLESDLYQLLHILFDDYEDEFTHDLPSGLKEQKQAQIHKDRLTDFISSYILRTQGDKIARVEEEDPSAAAILKLTTNDIKGACDLLEKAGNYKLMVLTSQLENADGSFQDDIRAQIDAWREQRVLSEMTEEVRALYELCAGNTTICSGKTGNNVPVEDKAKTFSIGDEYGLDWLQSFALGLWFGREEKRQASATGVVTIEDAVLEFDKRCQRREESQLPGNDPIWVILKIYASSHGSNNVGMPVFPAALERLNNTWDATRAFMLHYAITSNVEGVVIDEDLEEELVGILSYQLGSDGNIAGAAYVLMHLQDPHKRETILKSLLDRFAAQLPEPPQTSTTTAQDVTAVGATAPPAPELWTTLTQQLLLPAAWLYQSKALHARAVSADPTKELGYLVAAKSWTEAHDCFVHRVAPGLIVDNDIDALTSVVDLFDDDVMEHVPGWEMGGGIYADFALMCMARGQLNQSAVEGLRKRLVELGRRFNKKNVELGKLPIEELEERVAVQEMSRVIAEKFEGSRREILELPLTSDQRLIHTIAMAGEYYHGIMAGTEAAA